MTKKRRKTELIDLICAAENNPGDIGARLAVTHEYERRGEHDRALEELKEIVRAFPEDHNAFFELGNFFLRASQPNEAIGSYAHALKLNAQFAEASHNLGLAYTMTGRTDKAVHAFKAAVALKPDFLESHLCLASAQIETGNAAAAAARLEALWQINRDNPRLLYLLAAANLKTGEHLKATIFANEGLKLTPNDRALRLLRAEILVAQRQYPQGIEEYDKLLAEAPDDTLALDNRGLARQMTGDMEGAMEDFNRALEIEPDNATALTNRGMLLARRGIYRRAVDDLLAALKLNPRDPRLLHNLAVAYLKLNEYDQAASYLKKAANLRHQPSAELLRRLTGR